MLRKLAFFGLERNFFLRILQVLAYFFFFSFGDVAALGFFSRPKLVYIETDGYSLSLKNKSPWCYSPHNCVPLVC